MTTNRGHMTALDRLLAECDTAQKEVEACHVRFMEVSGDETIDRDVVMEALGECHDARFRVSRVAPKLARIVRLQRAALREYTRTGIPAVALDALAEAERIAGEEA